MRLPHFIRQIEQMPEDSGAPIAWGCVMFVIWIFALGIVALVWWLA